MCGNNDNNEQAVIYHDLITVAHLEMKTIILLEGKLFPVVTIVDCHVVGSGSSLATASWVERHNLRKYTDGGGCGEAGGGGKGGGGTSLVLHSFEQEYRIRTLNIEYFIQTVVFGCDVEANANSSSPAAPNPPPTASKIWWDT